LTDNQAIDLILKRNFVCANIIELLSTKFDENPLRGSPIVARPPAEGQSCAVGFFFSKNARGKIMKNSARWNLDDARGVFAVATHNAPDICLFYSGLPSTVWCQNHSTQSHDECIQ
jgi:hypothetical protein